VSFAEASANGASADAARNERRSKRDMAALKKVNRECTAPRAKGEMKNR
jgi:hypothetical protein